MIRPRRICDSVRYVVDVIQPLFNMTISPHPVIASLKNDQPVTNKLSAIITRMYFVFMISNDYVSSWIYDQNSYSNPLFSRPFEDFKNSLIELGLPVGVCQQMCKWRVELKPVYIMNVYESNLFDELARKLMLRRLAGLTSLLFMQWNKKK